MDPLAQTDELQRDVLESLGGNRNRRLIPAWGSYMLSVSEAQSLQMMPLITAGHYTANLLLNWLGSGSKDAESERTSQRPDRLSVCVLPWRREQMAAV